MGASLTPLKVSVRSVHTQADAVVAVVGSKVQAVERSCHDVTPQCRLNGCIGGSVT